MRKISLLRQFYVMFNHCLNFPESNTFCAPPLDTLAGRDFFSQRVMNLWSSLPGDIKTLKILSRLKTITNDMLPLETFFE